MDFSPDQIRDALLALIAFIISVSVHEFGHAWMANKLGDSLPRTQGRLTLSPLAHIDPVGTILMPLFGALAPGGFPMLAWGKPVQTNPKAYSPRLPQRIGHMLVSLMGPAMNLLLAVVVSIGFVIAGKAGVLTPAIGAAVIKYMLALNLSLMFFNLLPVPPLDGGAVLSGLLPERFQFIPRALQRYGIVVFFILLMSGVLKIFMRPAYHLIDAWAGVLIRIVSA